MLHSITVVNNKYYNENNEYKGTKTPYHAFCPTVIVINYF